MTERRIGLAVTAAIAIGVIVRVVTVATGGSVLGDGGLFHAMVEDLRAGGLGLPAATSYNQLEIPFVYPPAALVAAAGIGELTGAATLDLLRWMPLVLTVLTLLAFAWVASRALPPAAAVGAALAFALMPSAYGWLLAGGGLTRAAGLLFALLAAGLVVHRGAGVASMRAAIGAGALLGLSALSHPQAAVFGVVACAVLSWAGGPMRPWLARLGLAAVTALVVLAPWLAWVATTHGLDALLAAGNRLEPVVGLVRLLNLRFSGAPFMDLVGVVGVVGLAASAWNRQFRLPLLLVVTYLVGAGGGEFLAAVPWALLAGVGFATMAGIAAGALSAATPGVRRATVVGIGAVALFVALIGALGSVVDRSSKLHPLPAGQVAAMEWLATGTSPGAVVLVPTGEVWGYDEVSEWLPAFAQRESVGTVQGSEWLGAAAFDARLATHEAILRCAGSTAACYRLIDPEATIFVPKGRLAGPWSPVDCCPALRQTLADAGYEIVYDEAGATIARPGD